MNLAEIRRKAQAAAAQPAPIQAAPVQLATLQPAAVQPVAVQPVAVQPVAVQPVSALPEQPVAVQSVPALQLFEAHPALRQAIPEPPQWQPPGDWQPPVVPILPDPPQALREPDLPRAGQEPLQQDPREQELASLPEWEEPTGFDPAAVILKGRQSATGSEEVREADQVEASLELLCFRVATEDYAINIMDIKEIIKPREVTEVPRVPAFVRGILSLRGIIIPVFDMRLRLGLPEGVRSERERIVVVNRQGGFCGVLVDQVVQVVRIAEAKLEAPPVVLEGIDREFIQGIGRVAGRMLILLDMEKVLDIGLL